MNNPSDPREHVREQQIKKLMALGNPALTMEEFKAFQAGVPVPFLEKIEFKAQLADVTAKVATLQKISDLEQNIAASEQRQKPLQGSNLSRQSLGIQKFTGGMVTINGGLAKFS